MTAPTCVQVAPLPVQKVGRKSSAKTCEPGLGMQMFTSLKISRRQLKKQDYKDELYQNTGGEMSE